MANKKLVAELSVESDSTAHAHNCYTIYFLKKQAKENYITSSVCLRGSLEAFQFLSSPCVFQMAPIILDSKLKDMLSPILTKAHNLST